MTGHREFQPESLRDLSLVRFLPAAHEIVDPELYWSER